MFAHTFVIIVVTFALNAFSNDATLAPQWQLDGHHQSPTIEEAIKQYFEEKTSVLHVRVHLKNSKTWKYMIFNHLTHILRNSTKLTFRITIENKYLRSNKHYLYNLWYVDSYEALDDILPSKRKHFSNNPGYYAIILTTTRAKNNYLGDIQGIFDKMFSLHIIDVIVIIRNIYGKGLLVYSFEPFTEKTCGVVKPKIINHFIDGSFNDSELFHNKLNNFNNCTIRVRSRNVPPFFSYDENITNGSTSTNMKGIEAEILKIIAEHLQFRIELYTKWPLYINDTIVKSYDLLQNNIVDVLMGYYFYASERIQYFEGSLTYFTSPLVVYVKHHKYKSNLMWMIEPFQLNTWLAVLTMITSVIILLHLTRLLHHWGNWLDIIGSIFGESRIVSTRSDFVRFGIVLWYSSFIFLSSSYQAKLFGSYKQPSAPAPHTLTGLQDNNFTFLMSRGKLLKYWLPVLKLPEKHIQFIDTSPANLVFEKLLNSTGNVATLTTVAQMQYFQLAQHLSNAFDQVPEVVQVPQFCAYFRHHSFLVKPFNSVIARIRSSGLITRWLRKEITEPSVKIKYQNDINLKQLDMEKFLMVFFLLACGQLFAFIVFFIEILVGRYHIGKFPKKQSVMDCVI